MAEWEVKKKKQIPPASFNSGPGFPFHEGSHFERPLKHMLRH